MGLLANLTENKDQKDWPQFSGTFAGQAIECGLNRVRSSNQVTIEDNAVIMMEPSSISGLKLVRGPYGAILGGRAAVGKSKHIGQEQSLRVIIEPASAGTSSYRGLRFWGANAVVIEGVQKLVCSVVATGAIVTQDIAQNVVVAGVPA